MRSWLETYWWRTKVGILVSDFNTQVIEEFRANGGQVGGMFEGSNLIIITVKGAKSGKSL